jgi:peptide methionine sulfoxide reductase msrA/msrB
MHMTKLFNAIGIGTVLSALGVMVAGSHPSHQQPASPSSHAEVSQPGAAKLEKAIFAGGCFWGVEYYFQHAKGVVSTQVGYTGGRTKNPTYREVCSHTTGHIEALQVTYDANVTSYEELARLFFEIHDPTQANGQGPDIGEQYQSVVFYADEMQKKTTEKLIGLLKSRGYAVVTQLRPATTFWPAEEYHQKYYEKENGTPYCHRPVNRFG